VTWRRRANAAYPMTGRGTCAILLAICLPLGPAAGADVDPIQPSVTLRDSGYLLGDYIEERVDLTLPGAFSIDPDSLPLPGRVAPWMEMRAARIEDGQHANELSVVVQYQIFAEVEQAERVPIPAFKLRARDGVQTRVIDVPEKSFLLSPALPPTLTDEDRELKPADPPRLLSNRGAVTGVVSGAIAAAALAVYLLWAYDRLPFLPRAPGPFARLWRSWRRRSRRGLSREDDPELLHAWHAALNLSAGETLYPSTLPRLFASAPHLAPLRERIEQLFERTWQSFYGSAGTRPPDAADLLDLARKAADRERGVPC
jgi:mxaA protein